MTVNRTNVLQIPKAVPSHDKRDDLCHYLVRDSES